MDISISRDPFTPMTRPFPLRGAVPFAEQLQRKPHRGAWKIPNNGIAVRMKIAQLSHSVRHAEVHGIVVKVFRPELKEEAVQYVGFLLRDDKDTILVNSWGTKAAELDWLAEDDAVGIRFAAARERTGDHILTTSAVSLTLDNPHAIVFPLAANSADAVQVRQYSTSPLRCFNIVPLNRVLEAMDPSSSTVVSCLVMTTKQPIVQPVKTKKGEIVTKSTIHVHDSTGHSLENSWGADAARTSAIEPFKTVVLLVNIRVSEFNGLAQGTFGRYSLLVVNPAVPESETLRKLTNSHDIDEILFAARVSHHPAHCSRYLSVCDIMTSDIRNPEVFFTIAWVTLLQSHRCWVACTFCDSIIEGDSLCANEMCPSRHLIDGVSEGFQTRATRLSVTTTIADHTTSLPGVKLFGDAAVTMLDLKSADDFLQMNDEQRAHVACNVTWRRYRLVCTKHELGGSQRTKILQAKPLSLDDVATVCSVTQSV